MSQVLSPTPGSVAFSTCLIDSIGTVLCKTGGGGLSSIVVQTAGSADAVATLYDGTDATGEVLAIIGLGVAGPASAPNVAFARGLFVNVTGTTAPVANVWFQ